jgi:hypothetical protein
VSESFDLYAAARRAQAERKARLVSALLRPPGEGDDEAEPEKRPTPSFDGGARQTPRLSAETHEQTLARVLRTGEANAGGHLHEPYV